MLRFLIVGMFMTVCLNDAAARDNVVTDETLNLSALDVGINETTKKVSVDISMPLKHFRVSTNREMILTPMLIASDRSDSVALSPVVIAGRSRWYHYMRDGLLDKNNSIYRAGAKKDVEYHEVTDWQPWMANSTLEMRVQSANCCDPVRSLRGISPNGHVPMADINAVSRDFDAPIIFAPPVEAGPVSKALEGSAFVTFPLNRTELKPDFMNNRAELQKIINSIEQVRNDKDATISRVHIEGFASPEGSFNNNVRLAAVRTETLRRYVRDLYNFPDSTVTSNYVPEDWQGLREYMADSLNYNISHRGEIIELIDTPMDPDKRNELIQTRYPKDYEVILNKIYPWLRHSDYSVKYTIKIYTTLEEIKHAFNTDPSRLRPVDFFTLAQSYPQGSDRFNEAMMKGVSIYPDDPLLNLNCANIAMKRGDLKQAQDYMLKAGGSPIAVYARGVLAAYNKDYKYAVQCFEKANAEGVTEAAPALSKAQEFVKNPYRIRYVAKIK